MLDKEIESLACHLCLHERRRANGKPMLQKARKMYSTRSKSPATFIFTDLCRRSTWAAEDPKVPRPTR